MSLSSPGGGGWAVIFKKGPQPKTNPPGASAMRNLGVMQNL
ncbi:MAG: hypothetical protein ACK5HS_01975 [Mycoplasmatales bacterium]